MEGPDYRAYRYVCGDGHLPDSPASQPLDNTSENNLIRPSSTLNLVRGWFQRDQGDISTDEISLVERRDAYNPYAVEMIRDVSPLMIGRGGTSSSQLRQKKNRSVSPPTSEGLYEVDKQPTEKEQEGSEGAVCFICLESDGNSGRKQLLSSCSQCTAKSHRNCWAKWRRKQRLATLRARLLATNINDPMSCSICKSGIAHLDGERRLSWALQPNGDQIQRRLQDRLLIVLGRMLQASRGNDDEIISLSPGFTRKLGIIGGLTIILIIVIDLVWFASHPTTYWGYIIIPSLAVPYLIAILSCVPIAIIQRQQALGPLRERPLTHNDEEIDSSPGGSQGQLRNNQRVSSGRSSEIPLVAMSDFDNTLTADIVVEVWKASQRGPEWVQSTSKAFKVFFKSALTEVNTLSPQDNNEDRLYV